MTETLVDKVMIVIVPVTDASSFDQILNAMQQKMSNTAEKMGDDAGKKVSKGFLHHMSAGFKAIKSKWAALVGVSAGVMYGLNNAQDKTIENLQTQIDLSDKLGTTASKIGMSNEDFMRLYTVLRQGDTDSESAITTIKEFAKRLGEYKMTGAKSELFSGIKNQDNVARAFLEATDIINQEKDPARRATMIDQMFGGQGNEQLAEFFTKDIKELIKQSQGIDYGQYGRAITSLSNQDDVIKANRMQLERENIIKTALLAQGRGGEVIAKKESFDQQQLLGATNIDKMATLEQATEAVSVFKNAMVEGAGNLVSVFGKLGNSAKDASDNLDRVGQEKKVISD